MRLYKKTVLLLLLSLTTLFSQTLENNVSSKESSLPEYTIGMIGGMMGTGIFVRMHGKQDYLQVSGIALYNRVSGYTYDSNFTKTGTQTNDVYSVSAGLSYGYYLYKDPLMLFDVLKYTIKLVAGGSITRTNSPWNSVFSASVSATPLYLFSGGVGLGMELFSPREKGFMLEYSIDYGTSADVILGLSFSGAMGFNF